MIQLNLLPDVKKEFLRSQRVKRTVIGISILVTIGAVALTAILFATVYFAQPGLIAIKSDEIQDRYKELKEVKDIDKYLTIQNQLAALPELHENKAMYSRLFSFLKTLNPAPPDNIRLSSLQINEEEKSILFTGTTSSFKSFNVFQDTLRKAQMTFKEAGSDEERTEPLFTENGITIENQSLATSQGKTEVSFSLRAVYNEAAFKFTSDDVGLKVPTAQTSQSVTGTPDGATPFTSGGDT